MTKFTLIQIIQNLMKIRELKGVDFLQENKTYNDGYYQALVDMKKELAQFTKN